MTSHYNTREPKSNKSLYVYTFFTMQVFRSYTFMHNFCCVSQNDYSDMSEVYISGNFHVYQHKKHLEKLKYLHIIDYY